MRPCVMLLDQTTTALTLFAPPRKAKGEVNKFERKKQGTRNVLGFVTPLNLHVFQSDGHRHITSHLGLQKYSATLFNPKRKSSHLLLQKTAEGEKNYKMYATRIALQFKKIKWSSENSFTSLLYYFRPESADCYELRVIISFYARQKNKTSFVIIRFPATD